MIKDAGPLREWERRWSRSEPPDYLRNLAIFEGMYEHARMLDVLPEDDPLTGIEAKIRFAEGINVPTAAGEDGSGA